MKIDEQCQAVLLSLSAYWDEEFCADGRSDDRSAAVFALRGITQLHGKADGEKSESVEHAVDEVMAGRKAPRRAAVELWDRLTARS